MTNDPHSGSRWEPRHRSDTPAIQQPGTPGIQDGVPGLGGHGGPPDLDGDGSTAVDGNPA